MEKKIKTIILIAIIAGAGISIGLTAGIVISQEGVIDQLLLLLSIKSKKTPETTLKMWTWVSGSDTRNENGTYGIKGIPGSGNVPGARVGSISWTDSDDNLWLFGGFGRDGAGNLGKLNDLWMFNLKSGLWTWISGNDTRNENGTYGIKGVPASGNVPGARDNSISWTDSNDNLWLFGGNGRDSTGNNGYLNDLWMFNITLKWWMWVSGNDTRNKNGTYGIKGVPASENFPGARDNSISWTDSNYNLWLFGGYGRDNENSTGMLNDLWMFNMTLKWWMWVSGNKTINQNGTYGTVGVPSIGNIPGARYISVSWTGANDNLWLFGGYGRDSIGSEDILNDLWMFNMTSEFWMWVSGNDTVKQVGTYGTKGMPAAANVPGARHSTISWIDTNDNLWLFGGDGSGKDKFNDLWMFNITSGWWTWMSGSDTTDQAGIYGTKGISASGNIPGARGYGVSWVGAGEDLWLFGGAGRDGTGSVGALNDLWRYG